MKSTKHKIKIKYPQPHSIKIPVLNNSELGEYLRMAGHNKLKYQAKNGANERTRRSYDGRD